MKRLFRFSFMLLVLLLPASTVANPISLQQAQQNALSFLESKGKSITISLLRHAQFRSGSSIPESYYVFNIGNNDGYVVAAGDDCAPAILGYAESGYIDMDSLPANMKEWLEEYAQQIQFMRENGYSPSKAPKLTSSYSAISPLLSTTWDQLDPYNQNCPDFFSYGKCVTGCVATAMAQVMYYHRARSVTQTTAQIPAYTCRHRWISGTDTMQIHVDAIPAGSPIDWDNMLDSYGSSATTVQEQAVANLMKYCGAAVQMDYANEWNGGSGAYSTDVPTALKAYFNYSSETVLKNRSSYSTNDAWESLIYNELSNSRPVYYSGRNSSSGHAFVCDGYDGSGYYHINWGWSGTSDGYFLLSALDPSEQGAGGSSSGYNLYQTALINAQPMSSAPSPSNTNISFADAIVKALCVQNWDADGDGEISKAEAAAVTSLGYVFYGNSSISSFDELRYFTGLTSLQDGAFGCCHNLTSIMIPSSVTSIAESAFDGCTALTSITIPSSVTSINYRAFSACSTLTSMTVDPNNTVYDSRNNCNAIIKKSNNELIAGCKNTVIPSSVTSIGTGAFEGSSALTSITIPPSVNSIGDEAFYGCTGLTSITIPSSVMSIGSGAFHSCRGLESITISPGIMNIGSFAFYGCSALTSITIPSSVTSINYRAFSACSTLTSMKVDPNNTVYDSRNNCNAIIKKSDNELIAGCKNTVIPSSVTSIGTSAFEGCSALTSITVPLSVNSIGDEAFDGCTSLTSITIPSSVTSIGASAFDGCGSLTSIEIPSNVTRISDGTFSGCTSLTSITIPSSVTSIGASAFDGCGSLTSIEIPSSVTSIGLGAFQGCRSLTSIDIPLSVTSIGAIAFNGCSGISRVTSFAPIPPFIYSSTFSYVTNRATLFVPAGKKTTYQDANYWQDFISIVELDPVWATSISLNETYVELMEGESINLSATVLPNNATNKAVTWTSSNTSVASVNSNGVVTALASGIATIIATTTDGSNLSASCELTITDNLVNYDNCLSMEDMEAFCSDTIVIPVAMFNSSSIISFQTDIFLPDGVDLLQEDGDYVIDPSERMTRTHVLVSNDVSNGAVRVLCYSSNYKPFTGESGDDLFYLTVKVADDAEGDYAIQLKNTLLTTSDFEELVAPDVTGTVHVKSYLLGDANNSGSVTVTDVVVTSQYVLEMNPQPFVFEAADVNFDGTITVTDVSRIAWMVLNPTLGAPMRASALLNNGDRMSGESMTLLPGESRKVSITLDNEMDYTAFQFDLNLPEGLSASNFAVTDRAGNHAFDVSVLADGNTRALCYSPTLKGISGHEGALLTFDVTAMDLVQGDITVDGIELVTTGCQTVKLDAFAIGVNNSSAINEVTNGKTVARVDYFNLAGQQLTEPVDGVTLIITTYTDGTRIATKVYR